MLLVLDNYDSFTYNLVQYLGELGENPIVKRNDEITVEDIGAMGVKRIVISPGPCTPAEAGISVAAIKRWGKTIPTLGVCLGHQAIGEAYGGRVVRAKTLMHGKTSRISHDGKGIFKNIPNPLEVMRYHSLVVETDSLPPELEIVARARDDPTEIHGIRHRAHPVWGVQFHPESILTESGKEILRNFLTIGR
ncbi:MAG: aminodeoxychorismate/anthranilate synthase component II [Gemmatimonadales bacterium]